MAFTAVEFWRGVAHALLAFNLVVPLGFLLIGLASVLFGTSPSGDIAASASLALAAFLYAIFVSVLISSAAALVIGAPLAWWAGRALRREPRRRIHRAVHSAIGLVTGAITTFLVLLVYPTPYDLQHWSWNSALDRVADAWWILVIFAMLTAAAAVWGWWWTVRRADLDERVERFRRTGSSRETPTLSA